MRLEFRVTVWLLVLLGAAASATLLGLARFQRESLERQTQETGRIVALSIESSLEVSMLNNAREDIRDSIANVKKAPLIEFLAVYKRDGSPWIASSTEGEWFGPTRAALQRAITTAQPQTYSNNGLLSVYVPVPKRAQCGSCHHDAGAVLGAVGVTLNERPLQAELARSTRNSLYLGALPLLAGLLASVWAVRRSLLRPLRMLVGAADRVAGGDFAVRLPHFRGRELTSVAAAFNQMAARVERQAADLMRTTEQLRSDLEGMEEIQSLITSGAGLGEVLSRTAGHLGDVLGASAVAIVRSGDEKPTASWGGELPKAVLTRVPANGEVTTSAGPLATLPDNRPVTWALAPSSRGGQTVASVAVAWSLPRTLADAERDLITSVAGLVGVTVENADLLERLTKEEQSLEALLKKTLAAQEEERRRVARELHDETAQVLHALMMNIDLLETQVPARGQLQGRLEAVKALAEEAGRNLDKVMLDLRPALLDELGLVAALRWYVSQIREAWGLPIEFRAFGTKRPPEHVEVGGFRIAQEAISNAVRHSSATTIWVTIETGDDCVRVEVRDDGIGFDVDEATGRARLGEAVGLLGMKERTELVGGHLTVQSAPGAGTRVLAEIPFAGDGRGGVQ